MRSVKLLRSDKSGYSKRSDRPTDGHAECCLNWNVYDISVNCKFKMIHMENRTLLYVNIYGSYKLLKNSPLFGPACIYAFSQKDIMMGYVYS